MADDKEDRERLAITMATPLREKIDQLAAAERRGRSATIEILLEAALAAREDAPAPSPA
tara:strand:- start:95 stop:271 length:177 start_codon:yes stop_codon:yes gene_type:complete